MLDEKGREMKKKMYFIKIKRIKRSTMKKVTFINKTKKKKIQKATPHKKECILI